MGKFARMAMAVLSAACAAALFAGCGQTGIGATGTTPAASASSTAQQASAEGSAQASERTVEVTLTGGTGKASIESPAQVITADDGTTMLQVVWSSSNYDKMVVDGLEYLPVNESGNSVFEIPVAKLEGELPVQAETTAMSTPHMIDYVISFGAASESEPAEAPESTTTQVANFHNDDLGNGWKPIGSMPLKYAKCFTVDYYEGDYKLFCLSDGHRYLTVPEGKQVPDGLSDDIVVIQQPLGDVYMVASDTMCLFDALDALDVITVSGISEENWYIPAAREAMKSGAIAYGGKYSTPDYELLIGKGVRLAVESTMINHTPSVREKLIELGIPVLTEMSSYETEPLGRTEWVKCYGAMLDREDDAQALFDEQVAQIESVDNTPTGKTVAFFYINSNGAAIVRKPGDYVTKMIEQAGGSYIFNSLEDADASTSSVTLEMERFYAEARDVDVIIYNASIDSSVENISDLIEKNALLADFKAVQNGEVYTTSQNMYQQMMQTGRIIADFNAAITGSGADTVYVEKLG